MGNRCTHSAQQLIAMKHILLLLTSFFLLGSASAQITLEHTYPDAGYGYNQGQLFLWEFEASGHKYVKIDRTAEEVTLYNLDHTFYKSFSFANNPSTIATATFMYMSEHLFDTDDGIEYLYFTWDGMGPSYLRIYDEDGTVHLNVDSGFVYVLGTFHNQQYPIYNSPNGTKLVVSMQPELSARVYSLPGSLSSEFVAVQQDGQVASSGSFLFYPNPVLRGSVLEYPVPPGSTEGRLEVYNSSGQLVLQLPVDGATGRMLVDTAALPSGTYAFRLRVGTEIIGTVHPLVVQ